jgi:hypothetical protein
VRALNKLSQWLALAALLFAGCGKPQIQSVTAQLQATPALLDFGTVPVLNAKKLDFVVQNLGRAPLNITSLAIAPDSSPAFTIEGALGAQVQAGGKATVQVVFTPLAEEPETGTLDLETDDTTTPSLKVKLQGVGSTRAVIAIEATGHPGQQSLDFGRVGEGQVALAGIDIKSLGTADLIIDKLELTGDSDIAFQSSSRTPVTVPQGQTLTLQLEFAPPEGAPTPSNATLTLHCTDPDHQTVTVPITGKVNRAPTAQIADPGPLAPGQTVQLDGSASADPDGDNPIAFLDSSGGPGWTLARAPINSAAQISPGDSAKPQVTLDLPGQYVVRLVVTDSTGLQTLHPAERTLIAKPAQVMAVELVWDNPDTDLDLHFLPHGAQLGGAQDCWANNKEPDLGVIGDSSDDPLLTRDALDHFGPEEMDYANPVAGSYDIDVVFYANHGTPTPATTATVRIYLYGEIVAEYSRLIPDQGHTWSAATLDWPSGNVTKVDALQ